MERYWNLDGISIWYLGTDAEPGTTYSASVTVCFSINRNSWFWPGGSLDHISEWRHAYMINLRAIIRPLHPKTSRK